MFGILPLFMFHLQRSQFPHVLHSNPDDTAFVSAFASLVAFVFSDGFISHTLEEEDVYDSLAMNSRSSYFMLCES